MQAKSAASASASLLPCSYCKNVGYCLPLQPNAVGTCSKRPSSRLPWQLSTPRRDPSPPRSVETTPRCRSVTGVNSGVPSSSWSPLVSLRSMRGNSAASATCSSFIDDESSTTNSRSTRPVSMFNTWPQPAKPQPASTGSMPLARAPPAPALSQAPPSAARHHRCRSRSELFHRCRRWRHRRCDGPRRRCTRVPRSRAKRCQTSEWACNPAPIYASRLSRIQHTIESHIERGCRAARPADWADWMFLPRGRLPRPRQSAPRRAAINRRNRRQCVRKTRA